MSLQEECKRITEVYTMPGVTKHIYEADIRDIQAMWSKQLKAISFLLPPKYNESDIITLLKKYFPHEWKSVEYKKEYYDVKDRFIYQRKKKYRYNMPSPSKLLRLNATFNKLCKDDIKRLYDEKFDCSLQEAKKKDFEKKRFSKIHRVDTKIENAKFLTQSVTPDFLDKIIGIYERKNTTQKDKVYLLIELSKYYNPRIIQFFFKLNDTELNIQLREMAFKHLQEFNYHPRLRKQQYMLIHSKNKKRREYLKKEYPYQVYKVPSTPNELEQRIACGCKEQALKRYDVFVSHSSRDSNIVRDLVDKENKQGIFVFCDWMNDSDYLKRSLLCKETLKVIEHRLDKSDSLLFVRTNASLESLWCKYEISYFMKLGKPMYVIDGENIKQGIYYKELYDGQDMFCEEYEELLFRQ